MSLAKKEIQRYIKYPRTCHLNFGQKISKNDKILKDNL